MKKMCNYNENVCETCVYYKYNNCWPTPQTVVPGWDDKGNGIIVACKQYEKDEGQDKEYLIKFDEKYNS